MMTQLSIGFAYTFFAIFLLMIIPLIFYSGVLAAVSGIWRKDVGIMVHHLRERTHKAVQMGVRKIETSKQYDINKQLKEAFLNLDDDNSGEIDEFELKVFLHLLDLRISDEDVDKALHFVDKDNSGSIDIEEFRDLVSFVAPAIKAKQLERKYRRVFNEIDEDGSSFLDRDELRKASDKLELSFEQVESRMGSDGKMDIKCFIRSIEDIQRAKREEAAITMRKTREAFLYHTYENLRRKDGTFFPGSMRKALYAVGISLSTNDRSALINLVTSAPEGSEDFKKESLTFREFRLILSAALLHYESDYYPMSKYKAAFLSIQGAEVGFVNVSKLDYLLSYIRKELPFETIKELEHTLDRGDGNLLYDDFTDMLKRFIDSEAEYEVLARINDKGRLLRIELINIFCQLLLIPLIILAAFLVRFVNT